METDDFRTASHSKKSSTAKKKNHNSLRNDDRGSGHQQDSTVRGLCRIAAIAVLPSRHTHTYTYTYARVLVAIMAISKAAADAAAVVAPLQYSDMMKRPASSSRLTAKKFPVLQVLKCGVQDCVMLGVW